MKKRVFIIFIFQFFVTHDLHAQDTPIYEATFIKTSNVDKNLNYGFVSLSPSYNIYDSNLPTIPVSSLENTSTNEMIKLTGEYRERLLHGISLKETDSLFIYNYHQNTIVSFLIQNLEAIAIKSPYSSEAPLSESDYQIGFEFKTNRASLFHTTFVAVGNNNPFTNKLAPIIWTPIDSIYFPSGYTSKEFKEQKGKNTIKNTYSFSLGIYDYYLQESSYGKGWNNFIRHVMVLNCKNDTLCISQLYSNNNSEELNELLISNKSDVKSENAQQWTGYMIKDFPPVLFGFTTDMFGCTVIYPISNTKEAFEIKCDNRH